jgi:leucyl aminopeptidase
MAELVGASSKTDQVRLLPLGTTRLLVVGLDDGHPTAETLRRAVAAGLRYLGRSAGDRPRHLAISLEIDQPEAIKATIEGALLGNYNFQPISQSAAAKAGLEQITLVVAETTTTVKRSLELGQVVAEAVIRTRDWVNQPPNLLYPASMAAIAEQLAQQYGLGYSVLDEQALNQQGYGGLLAVGGGSSRPPRLVQLTWSPRGAKSHVALIGKGITFDSGGINLKSFEGMSTMKCDMAGAAACLATIAAAAQLGLKVKVTAWLALAENLPSATAYRPSDVLTMHSGLTVENYNTDAEGRLVLADALSRASQDQPDLMIDIATLTGACAIALGKQTMGLFASDDVVADQLLDAAEAAGEGMWQLPITEDAEAVLASKVADLVSGGQREGGALVAAAFLRRFTAGLPWAHLDIAGVDFHSGEPRHHLAAGATGAGVRSLVALLAGIGE